VGETRALLGSKDVSNIAAAVAVMIFLTELAHIVPTFLTDLAGVQ
jgi:hypothetical protein